MITEKTTDQLLREDIIRQTLEAAAKRIEEYPTNSLYQKVLRKGAQLIREMKNVQP